LTSMMLHEGEAEIHCKPANTLRRAAQDLLHLYQKLFEEFNNIGSYVDPPLDISMIRGRGPSLEVRQRQV